MRSSGSECEPTRTYLITQNVQLINQLFYYASSETCEDQKRGKKTQTTQSMSCAPGFSPSPDEEESNDEGSDCSYDVVKSKYASSKHSGEIDMLFIVITLSLIIHRQSPNSHKYP